MVAVPGDVPDTQTLVASAKSWMDGAVAAHAPGLRQQSIWNPDEVYSRYIPRIYHVYSERLYIPGIYLVYTLDIEI
jgi:hypothetical protein